MIIFHHMLFNDKKRLKKKEEAKIKDIHSMIQPNGVGGRNNNEKCESMLTHIYI